MDEPSEQPYSREESEAQRLDRNYAELLQELRVAQTGVQILFAFLLTIAFQQRFASIDAFQRGVYVTTLVAAAIAAVLLIGPVAAHRLLFGLRLKDELVTFTGRLATGGLVFRVVDELEAAPPQLGAGARVVGLRVRGGLARPVEEPARGAGERRIADEPLGRVHAVVEAVDVMPDLGEHHLGRHVRGRMQAVDGDGGGRYATGQLEARHDLGELALAVGAHAAVPVLDHQVVAVGADPSLAPVRLAAADAGVADQDVEAVCRRQDVGRQAAHLLEVGQVGDHAVRAGHAVFVADLVDDAVQPSRIAAVQDQRLAGRGKTVREGATESVGRAGDEDGPGVNHEPFLADGLSSRIRADQCAATTMRDTASGARAPTGSSSQNKPLAPLGASAGIRIRISKLRDP